MRTGPRMSSPSREPLGQPATTSNSHVQWIPWVGLAFVATISIAPFFFDPHPAKLAAAQESAIAWLTKGAVFCVFALIIGLRAWLDRRTEGRPLLLNSVFCLIAVGLTAYHYWDVDRGWFEEKENGKPVRYYNVNWQRALYGAVLNHRPESHGESWIPHIYRPLPYGFTRSLELWTGDWLFACLAYRCIFTYWFIWGFYRFVRRYHAPKIALVGIAIYALLYPLSIQFYMGQLTDPMSHALLAVALLALVENRWLFLAASLALGITAKETAVVLVPAYFACWWRQGLPAYARTAVLGCLASAAYLAVRVPFGWSGDSESINGSKLMIAQNLGLGDASFGSTAPLYQNYVQPLVFVGVFLPLVWKNWKGIDSSLKAVFLTLVPLVLLSSIAFSWLYESRNYVPLLPILVAMSQRPAAVSKPKQSPSEPPRAKARNKRKS